MADLIHKFVEGDRVQITLNGHHADYFGKIVTGTILRQLRQSLDYTLNYKVAIDNSGSQDSEGYNAYIRVLEEQLTLLEEK